MMYYFLKAMSWLISKLSPRGLERVAAAMAFLVFDVLRLRRALILKNLRIAFPNNEYTQAELVKIGRKSIYHFALTALEFFHSQGHDIAADINVVGDENIRDALEKNQGVYVLCFHLGNWEAMGAKISRTICPAHVLVKKVGSSAVNRFVEERRSQNGFITVKRKKKGDGFRAIKDVLQSKEIVGFVMDQARPGEPRLPFFGAPAKTNTSFAAIWHRAQAPIVPSYIMRKSACVHELRFFPEIQVEMQGNTESEIHKQSTFFNSVVERYVRDCPEQYFWAHNRWKV